MTQINEEDRKKIEDWVNEKGSGRNINQLATLKKQTEKTKELLKRCHSFVDDYPRTPK